VNRAGDGKRDKDEEKYLYKSRTQITFLKIFSFRIDMFVDCSIFGSFLPISGSR